MFFRSMDLKKIAIIIFTIVSLISTSIILYFDQNLLWHGKYKFMKAVSQRLTHHSTLIDCANVTLNLTGHTFNGTEIANRQYTWKSVTAFIRSLPAPTECRNKRKVAFIIPYRNREQQLLIFLQHTIPILRRQNINHTIFVIEQIEGAPFNRAKLLNVGFTEASKVADFDCYFFHDVDILLEDDGCLFCADDGPKHFATQLNKFGYKPLIYGMPTCINGKASWSNVPYFGGITRVTKSLMHEVNGFSNIYWAWGAEDDDFYLRNIKKGFKPDFNKQTQCKFSMLKHEQETASQSKNFLLKHFDIRTEIDGLNSLKYEVLNYTTDELFKNILVDIGYPDYHLNYIPNINFCEIGDSWVLKNIF